MAVMIDPEKSSLTAQHFSLPRIKQKTTKLARELERLISDAPGDTRRVLRSIAEGNLGRLPGLEALGRRFSRNLERLTGAIAFAVHRSFRFWRLRQRGGFQTLWEGFTP